MRMSLHISHLTSLTSYITSTVYLTYTHSSPLPLPKQQLRGKGLGGGGTGKGGIREKGGNSSLPHLTPSHHSLLPHSLTPSLTHSLPSLSHLTHSHSHPHPCTKSKKASGMCSSTPAISHHQSKAFLGVSSVIGGENGNEIMSSA